jgi:hypothetical protein
MHVGENDSHGKRMGDIWIAGLTFLSFVGLFGKEICFAYLSDHLKVNQLFAMLAPLNNFEYWL